MAIEGWLIHRQSSGWVNGCAYDVIIIIIKRISALQT